MSTLIEFTNLLHKCGSANAPEVRRFLDEHKEDTVFLQRAEVVILGFETRVASEKFLETPPARAKQ